MTSGIVDKKAFMEQEQKTNLFTLICMAIITFISLGILCANEMGIFILDKTIMRIAFSVMFILLIFEFVVYKSVKTHKYIVKYVIIFLVTVSTTMLSICLTFHGDLVCIIPIMLASQYSNKKLLWFSYYLSLLSVIIGVYGGYFFGIWNYNFTMRYMPLNRRYVADYQYRIDIFSEKIGRDYLLYFVIPRCLIITGYVPICHSISKSARTLTERIEINKYIAEHDKMTGLYNRNKFLSMLNNEYNTTEEVVLFYFDINNLKFVNDTMGHDKGDTLIKEASDSIKSVLTDRMCGFRLGGDEFLIVMKEGKEMISEVIEKWSNNLYQINHMPDAVECVIAYGIADGVANQIPELLKLADKKMYEDKRRKKEMQKAIC